MTDDYSDMILLPRPRSKKHPPMPAEKRAAQFSPFAALRGFDEEIGEAARVTEERIELGEDAAGEIGETLRALEGRIGERPKVSVTYFVPDGRKGGGRYETVSARAVKLSEGGGTLELEGGVVVPFSQIYSIELL